MQHSVERRQAVERVESVQADLDHAARRDAAALLRAVADAARVLRDLGDVGRDEVVVRIVRGES